jgi:hypothetical protein
VFPPIGIARVGDSVAEDSWFVGPEWVGQNLSHDPYHSYKDAQGRVKRQAARFRVYGFDQNNQVVAELTSDNADIEWTVKLANRKSSFFRFSGTFSALSHFLDPAHQPAPPDAKNRDIWKLRNPRVGLRDDGSIDAVERTRLLEINGGVRSIQGTSAEVQASEPFLGKFLDKVEVYLGQLQTDEKGRLLMLGGRGSSGGFDKNGSPDRNNWISNYANNELWHDDVSDGPVTAKVKLKEGREVQVTGGAWVVVTPPDFAPDIYNVVTLFDVFVQTNADHGLSSPELKSLAPDGETHFWRDIYPLLERMSDYSWVNNMALRGHGVDKPGFVNPSQLKKLADPNNVDLRITTVRGHILNRIRKPWHYLLADQDGLLNPETVSDHPDYSQAVAQANAQFMPPLSGDEDDRTENEPATWLALTKIQYAHLERWAKGDFMTGTPPIVSLADGRRAPFAPPSLANQPDSLTRSALERCSGGAFYPGIEMTAVCRRKELFHEAFRIDEQKYVAGDISRHMACPWQSDFYACNTWWWPAQRPDEIVHAFDADELAEQFPTERSRGELSKVLFKRRPWARGVNTARPNLGFLRTSWIPEPDAKDTVKSYFKKVRKAMVTGWPEGSFRGDGSDENPWRYQYLRQETLDRYDGKYFQAVFASPEEFVVNKLMGQQPDLCLDDLLRQLRNDWPKLPTALGFQNTDEFYEAYGAYAADVFSRHVENVFIPLVKNVKTAEKLRERLLELAIDGASSTAVLFRELNEGDLEHAELAFDQVCQSFADSAYIASLGADLGGYNGMVARWSSLGFVVERTVTRPGEPSNRIFVEAETSRYDGLQYRDYFHILMNLDKHPDFFDYAATIAEKILAKTKALIDDPEVTGYGGPDTLIETPFIYSPVTFEARMAEIYEYFRAEGQKMRPWLREVTRQDRIDRLLATAVFNQCDGSWLRFIADAGPTDEIRATLFEIWSDEVGNGDPSLHHGNLYTTLLKSVGINLPDLQSETYAQSPLLRDEWFLSPVFQLCVSLHSKRYFAEILGMTLFLEWEVLELVGGIKVNDYLNIDPQFLRMHVGIDNAEDGHGAQAKRAVELHLANVLNEGGELGMQNEWERIWRGFWAFATAEAGYMDDDDGVARRRPINVESRLSDMIASKAEHGRVNHGDKKLAADRINDLFEYPPTMLARLRKSQWIKAGDPAGSGLLGHLTTFSGPMYKIFTSKQLTLWKEWIEWLGNEGSTEKGHRYFNKEDSMRSLLRHMVSAAQASHGHARYRLPVDDGSAVPIADLFAKIADGDRADENNLMKAIVAGHWAVPFDPDNSPIVIDMLRAARPMGAALDRRFPDLNNQIGRRIIVDWIAAGCPIDGQPQGEPALDKAIPRLELRGIVQALGKGSIH